MNQLNTPVAPPRPSGHSESPDMVYVLRRYAWLIVTGAVLGTVVAGGLFLFLRKIQPRYTATVSFQVLAPPTPVGATDRGAPSMTDYDTRQLVLRQADLLMFDTFLEEVLKRDEFQHRAGDPDTRHRTQWLEDHPYNTKKYLRRDLTVVTLPEEGVFKLAMTTKDATEAATLVNAVAHQYLDFLKGDNSSQTNRHLESLAQIVRAQKSQVDTLDYSMRDYRRTHSIPAVISRQAMELSLLQQLTSDQVKAQGQKEAAKAGLENITKQVTDGTPIRLTADLEQYVEHGGAMYSLQQMLNNLEVQKAAAMTVSAAGSAQARQIDAQITTVEGQMADEHKKLEGEARVMMQQKAESDANIATAVSQALDQQVTDRQHQLQDLDQALAEYQGQADDLKTQQELYQKLQQEYRTAQLQSQTDDMRVRLMGGDALPPNEISWPIWYTFIPVGSAIGLLLSTVTAYLLVLTDTRVRTPRDISRVLQLPMLGFVPDESDDSALRGEIATAIRTSPMSMVAESFRQIRSQLTAQTDGQPISTLLVASIAPGGGATTVASNLAAGMALNGRRVLLVDANFYRPGLRAIFHDVPEAGLSDAIADAAVLESAIAPCQELPKLHLMGAGTRASSTSCEILESRTFRELLEKLKGRYEVVIFDGAPLNLVSDSLTLGGKVDGVIAVVRAGEVSRGTVTRVREQLRQVRANLLGFVLNAAQTSSAGYFKENYRTFYRYAANGARQASSTASTPVGK